MKTAIVIGATGVTGQHILQGLLDSPAYQNVIAFSRRSLNINDKKLTHHTVDFNHIDEWKSLIQGDDIFSALGTTRKQAGGKAGQFTVDYQYQADAIQAAAANGVKRLFLVSSPSANAASPFYYLKLKGQLDNFVKTLPFDSRVFFKPSIIEGDRPDNRRSEKAAAGIMHTLTRWSPILKKYKPITGKELGMAIVTCANRNTASGNTNYEMNEIFDILNDT